MTAVQRVAWWVVNWVAAKAAEMAADWVVWTAEKLVDEMASMMVASWEY